MTASSSTFEVEKQDTGLLLKAVKDAIITAKKESEDVKAMLERVVELLAQNQQFEQEIDGARSHILSLMLEQLREREAFHAEEYVALVDDSISLLLGEEKKAKPE